MSEQIPRRVQHAQIKAGLLGKPFKNFNFYCTTLQFYKAGLFGKPFKKCIFLYGYSPEVESRELLLNYFKGKFCFSQWVSEQIPRRLQHAQIKAGLLGKPFNNFIFYCTTLKFYKAGLCGKPFKMCIFLYGYSPEVESRELTQTILKESFFLSGCLNRYQEGSSQPGPEPIAQSHTV